MDSHKIVIDTLSTVQRRVLTRAHLYPLGDLSVSTFGKLFLSQEYATIAARGDPLGEMADQVNSKRLRLFPRSPVKHRACSTGAHVSQSCKN